MARCRQCGNTSNFNAWCTIKKVLEVELDRHNALVGIIGDADVQNLTQEEISFVDDDLEFAMVSCAWCQSDDIDFEEKEGEGNGRDQ